MASLVAQKVKRLPTIWEIGVQSLGQEVPLEKEMATHSSTLAWKIPWTEEPSRLQYMGLQRVGHNWATSLHFMSGSDGKASAYNVGALGSIPRSGRSPEKEMATHSVFLPGKSHGRRSPVGYSLWGRKESDTTDRLPFLSFLAFQQKLTYVYIHSCTHTDTHPPIYSVPKMTD